MNGHEDHDLDTARARAAAADALRASDFVLTDRDDRPGPLPRTVYLQPQGTSRAAIRLGDQPMDVGRRCSCTLHIDDDLKVSGLHARLQLTTEGVSVEDLGSSNGTLINGKRVKEGWLELGDVLTVGRTSFQLLSEDDLGDRLAAPRNFGGLAARSPAMRELFDVLGRLAPMAAGVHLHGEVGSGTERIARAIHLESPRREGPFIAAPAARLTAAQLFGDERRGAAHDERQGRFGQADGGTLLLVEVGELPRALQKQLGAVLATGTVRPAGGKPRRADVRLLTSSSSDLAEASRRGTFRPDLWRRIGPVHAEVPPLRRTLEDLDLLARELCEGLSQSLGLPFGCLHPDAVDALRAYDWLGNLWELEHVLAEALSEARGPLLGRALIEQLLGTATGGDRADGSAPSSTKAADKRRWRARLRRLFFELKGNISHIAKRLGIARDTVRRHLADEGLLPAREG